MKGTSIKAVCEKCGREFITYTSRVNKGLGRYCSFECANVTHNGTRTRLYRIWQNMKNRCHNPKVPCYKYYGGRGISVCSDWIKDFTVFRDWATQNGYTEELTLDRIDVNGNYTPDNCRWASFKQQGYNKQNTIKYKGKPIAMIAKNKRDYRFLRDRIVAGIPLDRPKRVLVTKYTVKGRTQSLRAWARELGLNSGKLHYWLNKQGISYIEQQLEIKG